MKAIPVTEAVGMVLGHDVTRIIPGQKKGPAFRKGHFVREEEIPAFLDMGKANIFAYLLVIPRLLAGETVTRDDIAAMGHGGLCAGCNVCRYPLCGFGKGIC
ncbi:hypothetical protein [Desulfosarcina ovata]|uniref:Uncharacterized protein n=1 Tax=Desulfosarcina ovata subsp. ovata TaxID=2752305 RepID=A0A5K8AH05_9BACT|nr:hypothetical protein [Desulfosarcina ovata]BBO91789.1 hypothetical protein DSCOOX_49690 [Desulfosarcina ovata subsp. ovata]